MLTDQLRDFCLSLPAVEEVIKWDDHLCFTLAEKIFCITGFEDTSATSIKVSEEDFELLTEHEQIHQAKYFAKRQWVSVENRNALKVKEWKEYIKKSYDLVKAKLPKKVQKEIDETV